ncbi:MAG: Fur family transcriptional regulator [Bacillota bacterium]|nr:Fur family transcriptional regulator [Bacillota bacterium]MDW7685012.1 Fur family transcriptional regulator [Bacillota bacterium]
MSNCSDPATFLFLSHSSLCSPLPCHQYLFPHAGRRLSACEIHNAQLKKQPRISLDTIYRNLRLLSERGLVSLISLQSGAVHELAVQHHNHLVCVDCEKVVCIDYCPNFREYNEQANRQGFNVLGHSFEVYGRCAGCRAKNKL